MDLESELHLGYGTAQAEASEASGTPIFEHYAEQVITFRGVTAPLGILINLCPVPKDQMDPLKIEQWTANILTEAGVEILPELIPESPEPKKKVIQ